MGPRPGAASEADREAALHDCPLNRPTYVPQLGGILLGVGEVAVGMVTPPAGGALVVDGVMRTLSNTLELVMPSRIHQLQIEETIAKAQPLELPFTVVAMLAKHAEIKDAEAIEGAVDFTRTVGSVMSNPMKSADDVLELTTEASDFVGKFETAESIEAACGNAMRQSRPGAGELDAPKKDVQRPDQRHDAASSIEEYRKQAEAREREIQIRIEAERLEKEKNEQQNKRSQIH